VNKLSRGLGTYLPTLVDSVRNGFSRPQLPRLFGGSLVFLRALLERLSNPTAPSARLTEHWKAHRSNAGSVSLLASPYSGYSRSDCSYLLVGARTVTP